MTDHFSNLNYKDEDTERLINGYFEKKRQQEREEKERLEKEEKERLEREAQERINKKKKGENLENKVQPVQNSIINPNSNLQFVTDENLYDEIIKYLNIQFPDRKDILLDNLSFNRIDGVMKGSNTYIATAIDMFLKKELPEYRIARQIDLEQNLSMFKGFHIDSGLALRNLTNNNSNKTIHLFNQLKLRGLTEQDFPIWINLQGLELDNNLNFNLTDESLFKPKTECLTWKSGTHYLEIDDFGLPKKEDKTSSRQIWTNNNALSRSSLGRDSNLYSGDGSFVYLSNNGRVVLSAKARSA
jgi:hypothetical protein